MYIQRKRLISSFPVQQERLPELRVTVETDGNWLDPAPVELVWNPGFVVPPWNESVTIELFGYTRVRLNEIYYKASITAQGIPEPSSLRGSTLGTRAAEHKGCNWACKLTDGCSLKSCVRPHAKEIKSTQLHACSASVTGLRGA